MIICSLWLLQEQLGGGRRTDVGKKDNLRYDKTLKYCVRHRFWLVKILIFEIKLFALKMS